MNPNCYKTDIQFDHYRMHVDVHSILAKYPSDVGIFKGGQYGYNRVSLVHKPGVTDPLEKVYLCGLQGYIGPTANEAESDYSVFNVEFRDLYLYEVYRSIEKQIGKKLGRVRIMRLGENSSLMWHRDCGDRYHIAIDTDPMAQLFVSSKCGDEIVNPTVEHMPADGSVWYLNTDAMHTASNKSDTLRFHLVFNVAFDL